MNSKVYIIFIFYTYLCYNTIKYYVAKESGVKNKMPVSIKTFYKQKFNYSQKEDVFLFLKNKTNRINRHKYVVLFIYHVQLFEH